MNDYLGRKKHGEKFTCKADSQKLINLANKHLESADSLKAQITKDETFKKQISTVYSSRILAGNGKTNAGPKSWALASSNIRRTVRLKNKRRKSE